MKLDIWAAKEKNKFPRYCDTIDIASTSMVKDLLDRIRVHSNYQATHFYFYKVRAIRKPTDISPKIHEDDAAPSFCLENLENKDDTIDNISIEKLAEIVPEIYRGSDDMMNKYFELVRLENIKVVAE